MKKNGTSVAHAFWSKIEIRERDECWLWCGSRSPLGYGFFRGQPAHRVAYTLGQGPISDRMVIRHKCDNPRCCNPFHLIEGTMRDNTLDMFRRGRANTPKGENHPRTKARRARLDASGRM